MPIPECSPNKDAPEGVFWIQLLPSRWACWVHSVSALLALAAIGLSALTLSAFWPLLLAIFLAWVYGLVRLKHSPCGWLELREGAGEQVLYWRPHRSALPEKLSIIGVRSWPPWLMRLRYRNISRKRGGVLSLWFDSACPESRRRLRIYLAS